MGLALPVSALTGVAAFEWLSPISMIHRELIFGPGLGLLVDRGHPAPRPLRGRARLVRLPVPAGRLLLPRDPQGARPHRLRRGALRPLRRLRRGLPRAAGHRLQADEREGLHRLGRMHQLYALPGGLSARRLSPHAAPRTRPGAGISKKESIMRRRAQLSFWLPAILDGAAAPGGGRSGDKSKEVDDGMDVYFRDADLLCVSEQEVPVYPDVRGGRSRRSSIAPFPGRAAADPPHHRGHVPDHRRRTTSASTCHHPDNAVSKADVSAARDPLRACGDGQGRRTSDAMVWKVASYEKAKDVVGARYNCSMCHTPQASNVDRRRRRPSCPLVKRAR